jgi:hypothetical protein
MVGEIATAILLGVFLLHVALVIYQLFFSGSRKLLTGYRGKHGR